MGRKTEIREPDAPSGASLFSHQDGQAMAEFLAILAAMLTLIFGTIQLGLIFHAKITLNYAAFEGVRAGSLNNGKFDAVKEGFARGLAPLYSYFDPDHTSDDAPGNQVAAFQAARNRVFAEFDSPERAWVQRLNPTSQAFKDFAPDPDKGIPNDNLMYRSSSTKSKSGTSIQDANLLHLRFYYCYPLYVPYVNRFIAGVLSHTAKDSGPECPDGEPSIRLSSVAVMRMQSSVQESPGYYNNY